MEISSSYKKASRKFSRNQHFVSFFLSLSILVCLNIFFLQSFHPPLISKIRRSPLNSTAPPLDPCAGRYIYMYNLPKKFNVNIFRDCKRFSPWMDLCPILDNSGLGPLIDNSDGVFPDRGWYNSDQFIVEVIFHNRMKQYDCLTSNYTISDSVYVPYYVGLDVTRYLWDRNKFKRNSVGMQLVDFLTMRPEWGARGGRDHFVVIGRTIWDFQLDLNSVVDWGSNFSRLPEVENMTTLSVESRPWYSDEFSIPYPTYFHPSKKSEVKSWQEEVRSAERPWLFSFVGAPRRESPEKVRNYLIDQCAKSTNCKLQECGDGGKNCSSPSYVMRMFKSSKFCLQPPGDSYTRRSVFDSMLAGCIPVFFNHITARDQYKLYFRPKDFKKFSVYIPEQKVVEGKVNVEDVLLEYNEERIRKMRKEVIKLIPMIIYKNPRYKSEGLRDAFDVAVDGVIEMIKKKLKVSLFSKLKHLLWSILSFSFMR